MIINFFLSINKQIKDNVDYYSNNNLLMVKVSGDGAKYSHTSSFYLLSFTFVRDDSSLSSSGKCLCYRDSNWTLMCNIDVYTIAAIKARESYEALKEGFRGAFSSINNLISNPKIKVNGETYHIKVVFCADYKVLMH